MIYEDCKRHVQTCRACQFQSRLQKNNELYPILVEELWKRIEINIVRLLSIMKRENKYIVICIDYMIKWAKIKLLSDKSAIQVIWFIYEEIICRYGYLIMI